MSIPGYYWCFRVLWYMFASQMWKRKTQRFALVYGDGDEEYLVEPDCINQFSANLERMTDHFKSGTDSFKIYHYDPASKARGKCFFSVIDGEVIVV